MLPILLRPRFARPAACARVSLTALAVALVPSSAWSQDADVPTFVSDAAAESLPDIDVVVTTPSPVKKKPRRSRAANTASSGTASTASSVPGDTFTDDFVVPAEEPVALRGKLKVADDTFVPVTVVDETEILAEHGANIADSLDEKPGISASTFTAGSSRPIIRGLDTNRVRIQENGIGTHDVSELSEDHAVPVDPFAAERVEVIRGPATLRYGSNAIGGVVAIENGRIPTAVPRNGIAGELKGSWRSVDESEDGAVKLTAGANGVVFYADGFRRRAEDYDTPRGKQFNTFVEADGYALGASLVGDNGFIGVAFSQYDSLYGITGGEEAEEKLPQIDLDQSKVMARGELNLQSGVFEAVRFWFGATDYKHSELVLEDEGREEGQRFENEQFEGRVELQHRAFETSLGRLRGAFGAQYVNRDVFGAFLEGGDSILLPAQTESIAFYVFEELDLSSRLALQGAFRFEHAELDGQARNNPLSVADAVVRQSRDFTPVSGSLGMKYTLPSEVVLSLNGQYVERAPADAELFSQGVHEATETFELGDPNLEKEKAVSIEASARLAEGPLRFESTAYYTRFDGFIFKSLTGERCGEDLASCANPAEDELAQVLFSQRDARFYGVELAAQYDVARVWNGVWGVDAQYDYVRARLEGGENVPRIPPMRLGGGLFYRDANWFARAGVLHAFDQDDFGAEEIATPGYTLVSAELSYTGKLGGTSGFAPEFTIGLKGENLADDEVLNHASFKREANVLQPGASVRVFGSIKLN